MKPFSQREKLLFVYNANAGKGLIRPSLSAVVESLSAAGFNITIYATQAQGEATEVIKEIGEKYEVVACSGGDGTINETISAVMQLEKKPKIAYFPTGTVNDFARSLNIPFKPEKVADLIALGDVFDCDIGSFEDRYFNYIAGFGAFTEVAYETSQTAKNSIGKFAYFIDAFRVLPSIRSYHMKVTLDGREMEGDYIYGMVSNSKSVGGFSLEGRYQRMELDDGIFEVILIKNPQNPIELEKTLVAVMNRDSDNPYLYVEKAGNITFECEDDVKWTLDGENGGIHNKVTIRCNRRAVKIFSPNEKHISYFSDEYFEDKEGK